MANSSTEYLVALSSVEGGQPRRSKDSRGAHSRPRRVRCERRQTPLGKKAGHEIGWWGKWETQQQLALLRQLNPQVRFDFRSPKIIKSYLARWVEHRAETINSVLWRLKRDPCEFKASLGCRVKPCVRTDVFLASRELFPINVYTCVVLPT